MKNLNLVCPINSLGYGISAYNIWNNIRNISNTTLFPIGSVTAENHWNKSAIIDDIKKQETYDPQAPCLKIWHPNDLLMKPHTKGLYCTYSFFESSSVTKSERIGYNISDIIITPTHWAKNILIENNIPADKIKVVNPGVDLSIFDHKLKIETEDNNDDYIFLNIGKWEIRKGHDVLVHMFNQAFEQIDKVRLLMINTNPFISDQENKQWQDLYKKTKLGNKIYFLPRLSSQIDIAKVMSVSNCGIYPARAEGWNNEAIETMAMNKPIILTNYTGHTEYTNTKNSYTIDIIDKEIAEDGKFFHGDGYWARLDSNAIDQAVSHMRYVYQNRVTINPEGLNTAQTLSWNKTSKELIGITNA